jgi:transcriptional regulator GlxA family with amidase domain
MIEREIPGVGALSNCVENMARARHMSSRNFIRRFKSATGLTPGDYLRATRIAIAKQLLESGARSVQTVCEAVGYEDAAFFRALFKRHTGMSPAVYREHFGAAEILTKRRLLRPASQGRQGAAK